MILSIEESPLYRVANPRSIAFFGASNNYSAMGSMLMTSTREAGFAGPIYPVHPKDETIQGLKSYRAVADLPETPDLAVIVLPGRIVAEILQACGEKGIRQAIIVSGGFKEVGDDGIQSEQMLLEIANKYSIRLLGPNCLGVANPYAKIATTPISIEGDPGYIGLASQSGSFIVQMYNYLARNNIGFSTAFSVGNQLNVDLVDCMEYLAVCPHTRVIALYIESINRGADFINMAKSIIPHKPIVALYVGGSETGRRAAFSHTGSMSGPDHIYDAMFKQCGIIRAHSITEMFDICWLLGSMPQPAGSNVAILSHSGGPGATAADICGRVGLHLPSFTAKTLERLTPYIPNTGNANNPVDLTFTRDIRDFFLKIPQILLEDENIDMLLIYLFMPHDIMKRRMRGIGIPEEKIDETINEIIQATGDIAGELRQNYNKPVVGFTFRSMEEPINHAFIKKGVPIFPNPERAARSMRALVQYYENRERISKPV
ncbi:MAG: CoA-binding protein [bacterium]